MQRPKQQALAFLIGAVLVGGVVGFSADRMMRQNDGSIASKRKELFDDLGLNAAQRSSMDSLFDARNCRYDALLKPLQPTLDSIRAATRAHMNSILAADQRTRLETRRKDDDARRDAERRRIQSACRT